MKKQSAAIIIFILFSLSVYARELNGTDKAAVNKVLETKLYVNDYEELSDQLNYLEGVEKEIAGMNAGLSEEAKLICKNVIAMQKETARQAEITKQEEKQDTKKKKEKKKDPQKEAFAMNMYNEYKSFADTHADLSSVFHYRLKEAELATFEYLSAGAQLSLLSKIMDEYKRIAEINPSYAEALFTYGMALYMAPKIAGGNKDTAKEKILNAINVAETNYEKTSALLIYSQILFDEKQKDESKKYLTQALKLAPNNKSYSEITEMNEAGYSVFHMDEYNKKKKK